MRSNVIRREESRRELKSVGDEVGLWLRRLKEADTFPNGEYRGQHDSQRRAIEKLIVDGQTLIGRKLGSLNASLLEPPVFSEECRSIDAAIVWLRRMDEHFRSRLDQRKDPRWEATLRAADEVLWSAWRLPVVRCDTDFATGETISGTSYPPGPTPLTGVEPEWSPSATPAERPLAARLRVGGELRELSPLLARYPVSLLALPPWCAASPWWLLFIAHEVGHHLQFHLELVDPFKELVRAVTGAQKERWGRWSPEVFADLVSVGYAGVWAVRALARIELARPQHMQVVQTNYPPSAVRIVLMARAAARLSAEAGQPIDTTAILRGTGAEEAEEIARANPIAAKHLALVDPLLDAALNKRMSSHTAPLNRLFGMPDPALYDPAPALQLMGQGTASARIGRLAARLRTENGVDSSLLPRQLETARDLICAAVLAWESILAEGDESEPAALVRDEARKRLGKNVTNALVASAPPGLRATRNEERDAGADAVSAEISDKLLDLGKQWMQMD